MLPKDNEIVESAKNELRKRFASPVFGTLLIYWTIFHWQFLVATFFVGEDKIWEAHQMLKSEYLKITFQNPSGWYFYVSWVFPVILTYLTIWKFPRWFLLRAHKEDAKYRVAEEKIRLDAQKDIIKTETEVEKLNVEKLEEQAARVEKEKEVVANFTEEERWEQELEGNIKNGEGSIISPLLAADRAIYTTRGRFTTSREVSNANLTFVDPVYLSTLDVYQLVEIDQTESRVSLTNKGRFFVKKLKEKNLFKEIF